MSSRFLPVYASNALGENEELLPAVIARSCTLDEVITFCRNYRITGIAGLLVTGSPEELWQRLSQSARAFAHWLAGTPDESKLGSVGLPYFDALAAGDELAAKEVALRQRHSWARGEEYEEDFLLMEFLTRKGMNSPPSELQRLLERWRIVLDGASDARLDVCSALVQSDGPGFSAALAQYLDERAEDFLAQGEGLSAERLATEGNLSVEGLGFLRLAGASGLRAAEAWIHVPEVARVTGPREYNPEAWKFP